MRTAIVGYGKMGRIYDSILPATCLVDPKLSSPENCELKKTKKAFLNIKELIKAGEILDLIIISSPTETHFDIAFECLNAGYNVLVEKPICLHVSQSIELEEIANKKSLFLFQSTPERFNPIIKLIKENYQLDSIKSIESFRFGPKPKWQEVREHDVMFDLGIHDIDLWSSIFKRKIPWKINVGYGALRRELRITTTQGETEIYNLLNTKNANPIKEQLNHIAKLIKYKVEKNQKPLNESWNELLQIIKRCDLTDSHASVYPTQFILSQTDRYLKSAGICCVPTSRQLART